MADTVYMNTLRAAQQAAWADPDMHIGQRWVAAYAAAYRHIRDSRFGWLLFPHAITSNAPEGLW